MVGEAMKKAELQARVEELENELEGAKELHAAVARQAMEDTFDDAMMNAYERRIQAYKAMVAMTIMAMVALVGSLLIIL